MSETPTPAMLKLGAAAAGGYVLGRFKKGRTAVGLALWLAGSRTGLDPRRLLREGLVAVLRSPEAQEVLGQLRGPVLEAGRRAAAATLEHQAGALANALEERTAALTSGKPSEDRDTKDEDTKNEDTGDRDTDRDEDERDEEEPEEEEPEEESEEEQPEDEEPEEEPEERRPRKATAAQPRKREGQKSRSAQESRTPRRPRKEGARA